MKKASAVTSTAWGAAPTAQSVSSAPPCLTIPLDCGPFTAANGLGLTTALFEVWNTGDVALTGLSYDVALSSGDFTLASCSVAWSVGGTCSGTATTVLQNEPAGTYPVTTSLPGSPGSVVYMKITTSLLVTSVTVSTAACSGGSACTDSTTSRQIRAAVTTNA
ncbi:MAG TPA: hypothetical protein VMR97_14635 [Acidimicrobiales bacterium]|nr:hypothetical protein [Acidimicrobiales bacterium]